MTTTNYRSGADVLDGWRDDVLSGKPPTYYPIGEEELSRLDRPCRAGASVRLS